MKFEDLNLHHTLLKAVKDQNYTHPTAIQQQAIPLVLKKNDVLGSAQTGTGKTAAFALPILHHLINEKSNNSKISPSSFAYSRTCHSDWRKFYRLLKV